MDLDFIEEEIPTINRVGGAGREAEPWEQHISPLKDEDKAGKSFRVWTYAKRPSATSRMSSVRERLTKVVPQENWKLAVRPVPGTGTDPDSNPEQFGVYVTFAGIFTDEQVAENAVKHAQRSERVKNARAAAEAKRAAEAANATTGTPATDTPTTNSDTPQPEMSAKERVAAARARAEAGAS
jgi:hypothetical protein